MSIPSWTSVRTWIRTRREVLPVHSTATKRTIHRDEHLSLDVTAARLRLPPRFSTIMQGPRHQSIYGWRILPRRHRWRQDQHHQVPLVNSLTGAHGQSLYPHAIYGRIHALQRAHEDPQRQVQHARHPQYPHTSHQIQTRTNLNMDRRRTRTRSVTRRPA